MPSVKNPNDLKKGAGRTPANVETASAQLFPPGGGTENLVNLQDQIDASLASGLDEKYRRSTFLTIPGPINTPGSGRIIDRDGEAVEVRQPLVSLSDFSSGELMYDPQLASIELVYDDTEATGLWPSQAHGGDIGLYQESAFVTASNAAENTKRGVPGPMVLETIPRVLTASTAGGANVLTRIDPSTVAQINPDSGGGATDFRTVEVGGSDYVHDGSGNTALRTTDLIEITDDTTGDIIGTFLWDGNLSSTRFLIKTMTGLDPVFGSTAQNIRLHWLQPTMWLGGSLRKATGNSARSHGFTIAQPGRITDDINTDVLPPQAVFLSADRLRGQGEADQDSFTSVAWGGFNPFTFAPDPRSPGDFLLKGRLYGDGGFETLGGRQINTLPALRQQSTYTVTAGTSTLNINELYGTPAISATTGGSLIYIVFTPGGTPEVATNLDLDLLGTYQAGDTATFILEIVDGFVGGLDITWPSDFKFSGTDGIVPSTNSTDESYFVRYDMTYVEGPDAWFIVRTDY